MGCNGMASSFFPASPQPPPTSFFLQIQTPSCEEEETQKHHQFSSSLTQLLSPPDYHAGMASLLGKRSMSLHSGLMDKRSFEEMNGEDEFSDDCSQLGEKKRRLNMDQVRTLEKNFELGNKLEPERKMQLARALGLQPRQIAIWFQNRRARWKTKQLEKDYDVLKKQFEAVKSENDILQAHNKKLQAEIMSLNGREISSEPTINLNKETEVSCSYRSDNNHENLRSTSAPQQQPSNNEVLMNPSTNQLSMSFFPISPPLAHGMPSSSHLLQRQDLQCPKLENNDGSSGNVGGGGGDDSFCNNMFCSLDDQPPGFWTSWQEQQSFR